MIETGDIVSLAARATKVQGGRVEFLKNTSKFVKLSIFKTLGKLSR